MRNLTDQVSEDMRDAIEANTPVKTGRLRESIKTLDTDRRITGTDIHIWTGGAISRLDRASYTEYDTAPHIIGAKTDSGLIFFDRRKGMVVSRQSVRHPGTTGVHMFAKGAEAAESVLAPDMEAMLIRWARRYGL
jgi:hypothetical protein